MTTNFVYDGLNPVQEKNGAIVTANLLTGLGIDEFLTRTDSSGTKALLPDGLGSTVALDDGTGTLPSQYTYEPFGFATNLGAASTNSYKYTGREEDGTGLLYYRARYYHPRLQRFLSEDPLGFEAGDVNLYAYVFNNAINYEDPLGLAQSSKSGGSRPGGGNGPSGEGHLHEFFDMLGDWANPEALRDLKTLTKEVQKIDELIKQKNLEGQDVDLIYDKNKQLINALPKRVGALCSLGGCKVVPYPAKTKPKSIPPLPVNKPLNKKK